MSGRTKAMMVAAAIVVGAGAAVIVGGAGLAVLSPGSSADSAAGAETTDKTNDDGTAETTRRTSVVEIATLTSKQEFNADLGFGDTRDLMAASQGTLTWVPEVGQEIRPGEVLWEIDRQPVIYMMGDLPMYRELYKGVKKGDDVTQLEEFLIAEGFGPEGWEADDSFNNRTRAAVKAFQKERGMTVDGVLGPAQMVVGNEPLRVEARAEKGSSAEAGPVLSVTDATAKVTLASTSRQLSNFQKNPDVIIVLGDGTELTASLDKVKSSPADENGAFGYELSYLVDSSISEAQPVKVKLVQVLAADALTVPVDALIALAEGGYAVEVKSDGATVLRAVEVIDFDDARVAITGDVVEGDEVVVAT